MKKYNLEVMQKLLVIGKPVLSSHSEINKTKVLKPCGTLMQVKSSAECENSAILLICIKLVSVAKTYFCLLLSDRLRQVLLYYGKS